MLTLYHTTTSDAAASIKRDGFIDHKGSYGTDIELTGVWLSDIPLDVNDGAKGEVVLAITLDVSPAELADFELIEGGKPHREWCVPAKLINDRLFR